MFLEDYAFLINALNDLYDKTMNFKYKNLANKMSIQVMEKFYLEDRNIFQKNLKKIKKNADLILASNVFAHSDDLKGMAECMIKLLNKNGNIVIEVQYLLNTLQDLTFDNIYHEHYNYWSLTSLNNFFNNFEATIYKAEKIETHGGSIRIFLSKREK